MITIISNKINTLNQKKYSKFLEDVDIYRLTCSCGLSGCLIKHAYYKRSIKTPNGLITLSILRVKCKHCGITHAIFPMLIVPYSKILLSDHISIIKAYTYKTSLEPIMIANECIDERNIRYVTLQYLTHWKERIAAFLFSLDDMSLLVKQCLLTFKRQFMQIKCTPNVLFC